MKGNNHLPIPLLRIVLNSRCSPLLLGLEYVDPSSGDRDYLDPSRRVSSHPLPATQNAVGGAEAEAEAEAEAGSGHPMSLRFRLLPEDAEEAFRMGNFEEEDEAGMELLFNQVKEKGPSFTLKRDQR